MLLYISRMVIETIYLYENLWVAYKFLGFFLLNFGQSQSFFKAAQLEVVIDTSVNAIMAILKL